MVKLWHRRLACDSTGFGAGATETLALRQPADSCVAMQQGGLRPPFRGSAQNQRRAKPALLFTAGRQASFFANCSSRISRTVRATMILPLLRKKAVGLATACLRAMTVLYPTLFTAPIPRDTRYAGARTTRPTWPRRTAETPAFHSSQFCQEKTEKTRKVPKRNTLKRLVYPAIRRRFFWEYGREIRRQLRVTAGQDPRSA